MVDSYTNTEEYQQEVAEQYKKRVTKFTPEQVVDTLAVLGVTATVSDITQAAAGNVNATYLTSDFAIKINQNRDCQSYLANKIAADKLSGTFPVPKVIAYDFFERTRFEVLVMERVKGDMLLDTIFDLNHEAQISLFKQVLTVVNALHKIEFDTFGEISSSNESFPTYADYLKAEFAKNATSIREQNLAAENSLAKIEDYFYRHVDVLKNDAAVFVHTDIHMGNILHQGEKLTALIDFDGSLKAPPYRTLKSILEFVDHPSWFVEGTPAFKKYQGKNFHHLFPTLKSELADVFTDPLLARKLNIIGIEAGIMWVAGNWSAKWNEEMIHNLVTNEIAETEQELKTSYYGQVLSHK
jgi:aminoglycoside phosphotransferase (APT) family kinase protein